MKNKLTIGTRGSQLAMWQAEHVAGRLRESRAGLEVEIRKIVTTGDKILDAPLAKIGGKALFTKELETAMLAGEIDLAVHSLKDMPAKLPEGLALSAVTKRENPGDALISPKYGTLNRLPRGAKVGTSSLRRKAQLLNYRADIEAVDIRGNVNTRLEKLKSGENLAAILLAVSGLNRLGWEKEITEILPLDIFLPAVGQGALAIETRADDAEVLALIQCLNDETTAAAVTAERAFLAQIEGSCQIPVGAYASIAKGKLTLTAAIFSLDGKNMIKDQAAGESGNAQVIGVNLAKKMLDAGGRELLAEIGTVNV